MENKNPLLLREHPWGKQPGVTGGIRVRKNSLAIQILKGVAVTGMVLVAASNPYFGINLIKALKKEYNKAQWRKFQKSIRYLKSRGYVHFISETPEGMKIEITRAGERIIKHVDVATLELSRPRTWDKKWRVVVFDVPNYKSKNRAAFREKIKELGFVLVQKSVWVYPH